MAIKFAAKSDTKSAPTPKAAAATKAAGKTPVENVGDDLFEPAPKPEPRARKKKK